MSPEPCSERSEELWFRAFRGSIFPAMDVPLSYCVYVLRSLCDGALYIGFTQDLTQRLAEHNAGESPATAPRRPFVLLFCECFATKAEATAREKYLKTTKGHRALRLMLRDALATEPRRSTTDDVSQPSHHTTQVAYPVPKTLR